MCSQVAGLALAAEEIVTQVESAVASVAVDKVRSYRLELEIISRVVRETSSIKVSPVSLEHQIMYIESHDAFSRQACIH